ncbi:MAG TPA: tetrahydromethanopterin S-methyltransferase subunit C [Methanoregulaceae archaeon]|nr:tetrahydromethanopterin S-methyltransferase subunit C [Methanoregulaceae archaeon]
MTAQITVTEGGIPHNTLMIYGLVGSIIGIYLTYLNTVTGTQLFSFFGGLGAIAALIWGSSTIKRLCSYGIGTGVPSAGMLAFGSGVIAMLLATKFGIASPIVALVLGFVIGAILGYIANNILAMKIPVMIQSIAELAAVGALVMIGFSAMVTGSFTFSPLSVVQVSALGGTVNSFGASLIGGGLLAAIFMLGSIALQHGFNACLGPSEKQDRTLMLTAEVGFLSMIMVAIFSFAFLGFFALIISIVVSVAGWYYTYAQYIALSKRDAAAWLDSKPIVEAEGH